MGETLNTLGIYWPKLLAQTVNFGIVLFVLWKFAYKPVLVMLEVRRQKVAQSLKEAEEIKAQLAKTEAERAKTLQEAGAQAGRIVEEARAAAERELARRTQEAIATANQILAKAREASEVELARMKGELRREVGRLVVDTTAKVAGKVLTSQDQQRLLEETQKQLAA